MAGISSILDDILKKAVPGFGQQTNYGATPSGANDPNRATVTNQTGYQMPATRPSGLTRAPASADLGLGDQITQQLADQEEERKKKMMGASHKLGGSVGDALGLSSGAY